MRNGLTSLQSLNYDVLVIIVSYISPEDALSLSTVSRHVHTIAKLRSLSEVTLHRLNVHRVCTYMLEDIPNRLHHLRRLNITIEAFGVSDITRLRKHNPSISLVLAVFLKCRNLRSLSMEGFEDIIRIEPDLGNAFAALDRLAEVELKGAAKRTVDVLNRMRSQPYKLVLDFSGMKFSLVQYLCTCMPLQSVRVLKLRGLVESEGLDEVDRKTVMMWPAVRHMSFPWTSIKTCIFFQAFPHLRWLHVDNSDMVSNRLRAHGHIEQQVDCPVHYLRIDQPQFGGEDEVFALVKHASPVILALQVWILPDPTFISELLVAAPRLRCLILTCIYCVAPSHVLPSWMESITSDLALSKLICVQFRIDDALYQTWDVSLFRPCFERLAKAALSLQYMSIGIGDQGHKISFRGRSWWWRAKDSAEDRRLLRISTRAGERMLTFLRSIRINDSYDIDNLLPDRKILGTDEEVSSSPFDFLLCPKDRVE